MSHIKHPLSSNNTHRASFDQDDENYDDSFEFEVEDHSCYNDAEQTAYETMLASEQSEVSETEIDNSSHRQQ